MVGSLGLAVGISFSGDNVMMLANDCFGLGFEGWLVVVSASEGFTGFR
ncbi:MAG: hypothetical protein OXT49_07715 [Gammaproteobacteria bacterium]|nr:hypothetical protein [Gammaproteobacteria bacterium]